MQADNNLVSLSAKQGRSKRFSELFIDEDVLSSPNTHSKPTINTNPCSVDAAGAHTKSEHSAIADKSINSDRHMCKPSAIRECHNLSSHEEEEDHGLTSSVVETSHVARDASAPQSAPRLPSSSARKKGAYTSGTASSENKTRSSVPASETKGKSSLPNSETRVKSSSKRKGTHSASKHAAKPRTPHDSALQEKEATAAPSTSAARGSKTHSSRRREEPAPEVEAVVPQPNLCMEDLEPESPNCDKTSELRERELVMLDEEDVCCICLETYEVDNPKFTAPCTHHFHLACLLDWKQRNNTCPMCCAETLRGVGGDEVVPPPPTNRPDCTMDEIFARRLQVHYLQQPQRAHHGAQRGGQSNRYVARPGGAPGNAHMNNNNNNNNSRSRQGQPQHGGMQSQHQRQLGSVPQQQQQHQSGSHGRNSRVKQTRRSNSPDKKSCTIM